MQTVVHIKDGIWSNLACIGFMLGLSALTAWLDYRSHGEVSIFAWLMCAIWLLFCYIPIDAIRKPKSRLLAIDGDFLVWRIRTKESETVREERLPLRSIRALEFVLPQSALSSNSRLESFAELFFITTHGQRRELPSDFFPGVYRKKIIAAIQQHVPNVEVLEKNGDAD